MNYYVYVLRNANKDNNITYVGYTNNLKRRIQEHNSNKGAKFTKGKKWTLLYKKFYNSKTVAMSEEYKLKKNYKLRKKIKELNGV